MGQIVTPKEFLQAFYGLKDIVNLRAYPEKKDLPEDVFVAPRMLSFPLEEYKKHEHILKEKNEAGYCGVHFNVNAGGTVDKDITRINALYFENDDMSFAEQIDNIASGPLEPSIIVRTKRSLHTYFLVNDLPVEEFRYMQDRLNELYDGDRAIRNESRTMRLPGFYHVKEEPFMVPVVKFNPELRYTYWELDAILPQIKRKKKKKFVRIDSGELDIEVANLLERIIRQLEIAYETEEKIVCHCLFPEKHSAGDRSPSAVLFKGVNGHVPGFFCSGCGYISLHELRKRLRL